MPLDTRQRIPTEELRPALERLLSEYYRASRVIRILRRRVSAYASSCTIENLEVELDHGRRLRLVFKDLSPTSLLPTARQVRPGFLYDPQREIAVYRDLLPEGRWGTPVYYGSVTSPESGRYWLFLERVAGPLLWQVGRRQAWAAAARWLAALHSEFTAASLRSRCRDGGHLLLYDEALYRLWPERAERHLSRSRGSIPPPERRRFVALTRRYDRVIRRLMELPQTFIHGEFYPSNVILRAVGRTPRVSPFDWELAALAPGLLDLGALTSGDWSRDDRRKMIAAYRDRWEPVRGGRPSLAELEEGVAWCQLHLAVQFLGWASDWSPPELHAQDWLDEAVRLAQQLSL
jgi:aminoglycoside phosphotransferase (APT) family kinase protein